MIFISSDKKAGAFASAHISTKTVFTAFFEYFNPSHSGIRVLR